MSEAITIRFGARSLRLPIDVAQLGSRLHEPVQTAVEPAIAMQEALANPTGYPALDQALLPGDRVVIAIDSGVPSLPEVLAGTLAGMSAASVSPESLTILLADCGDQTDNLLAGASPEWESTLVTIHDPTDQDGLAYLAANKKGEPIYFNRAILDADFVLPISVARGEFSLGDFGIFSGLFPRFTDAATACRFLSDETLLRGGRAQSRAAADEAGWLLGTRFIVQIIPAADGGIAEVIAGDIDAVAEQSQRALTGIWQATFDEPSPFVVACVGGGRSEQNWNNMARALDNAMRLATEDGTILLCCDIDGALDRGLQLFRQADADADDYIDSYMRDPFRSESRVMDDDAPEATEHDSDSEPRYSPDLMLATSLRVGLENHRIYLMSGLDEDEITELGMIHVSSEKEAANLCHRHDSCAILPNAQHVQPKLRTQVTTP